MLLTGAEILVKSLLDEGVDTVFGYPGGAVLNIYDYLYKDKDTIKHHLSCHEQNAAHAADGYARSTGKVGVCIATSGPGATNLVTGIATAYMDSIPLVAITGNVSKDLLGKDSFQEVDITGITMPITKHNFIVKDINNLQETIRKAFYIAREGRPGPVLIDIPKDITADKTEYKELEPLQAEPKIKHVTQSILEEVSKYINTSSKPLIYAGGGVINAKKNYIKVTNGSTAAASIGTNSNIDLSGGITEFNGSGYAVYSDGVGKIDLSGSKMILKGKSTAFDLNLTPGVISPIKLDSNSRIHVASNDVVVFNLQNATGLSTNGLENSITTALGGALGSVNLDNLIVAEAGADKYKTAAVDGGTITIGNLDKTGTGAVGETQAQKDGNFYYNRFLGQRLVATATGSTISAVLDDTQAS